jgi:hypothetical protein
MQQLYQFIKRLAAMEQKTLPGFPAGFEINK